MPFISAQSPLPATTLLVSDLQRDLAQHADSVIKNGIKQLQLRPRLERSDFKSTLSYCFLISPPPDLDFAKAVPRGGVIKGTSARDDPSSIDFAQPPRTDSPFCDLTQPHQISIMTKNGIFNLYVSHAQGHIERHETRGKLSKISRARVELELLNAIDEGVSPIEYKMCWTKAILSSNNFESFWLDKSRRLKLPQSCIERYSPSDTYLEYEIPTSSASETGSPRPLNPDQEAVSDADYVHVQPTQLPTPSSEDEEEEEGVYVSPEAAVFARRLGGEHTSITEEVPSFDPRGIIGVDLNGLARETGDDGAWGGPKKNSKPKKSHRASTSTQAKPRKPNSPITKPASSKEKNSAKSKATNGVKRDFVAVAGEVGPYGTPYKKVKKTGGSAGHDETVGVPYKKVKRDGKSVDNGTSGAGRQRKKTEKAKVIAPGQI